LADDAYNTRPFLKFAVQFACGITFVASGIIIKVFPWDWLNYVTTVFWVVGMMNSVNMLDNMDGITASVSSVICFAAIMILVIAGDFNNLNLIVLIGVLAGIVGFLYYNWHPSRMYMGDSGSQFLGVFLAATGIGGFWNAPDVWGHAVQAKQIIVALLIFAVPIADTTTVSINRLLRGQSPFVGGKDHTTHHLAYLGFSERQIAMIMVGISLFTAMTSVFIINYIRDWHVWHTWAFGALFVTIVVSLYSTTYLSKAKVPK
jgi:UDP-GlcNAc:undecaprenyl-phosphate GlcNAc-1-phosphate transferase